MSLQNNPFFSKKFRKLFYISITYKQTLVLSLVIFFEEYDSGFVEALLTSLAGKNKTTLEIAVKKSATAKTRRRRREQRFSTEKQTLKKLRKHNNQMKDDLKNYNSVFKHWVASKETFFSCYLVQKISQMLYREVYSLKEQFCDQNCLYLWF